MDTQTIVASIPLTHPIMNAAGPNCKMLNEILELSMSPVSAVMGGSATKEPREGNSGEVYYSNDVFSLNSLGLPNPGQAYYEDNLPQIVSAVHAQEKPFFFSVAGFSPEEYESLAVMASKAGVDFIELNLGCPNVWDEGEQKRITCFDPETVHDVLRRVSDSLAANANSSKLGVKLSPFSDPVALTEIAKVITEFPSVRAITTANTFPNAFAFNEHGKSAISPEFSDGLAGLAGPAMKAIVLGQIKQLRTALTPYTELIDIIGVGGISTGRDVWEYLQAGATAVQIGTAHADRGTKVFSNILSQYINILTAEEMVSA